MSKIEYFKINLKNETPFYRSHDKVAGAMVFKLNERLKVNSVSMLLTGCAVTRWY